MTNSVLICNARIFDGRKILEADQLLVENGQISQIGRQLKAGTDLPTKDLPTYDGQGNFLMPGLIDAHTHIHTTTHLSQACALGVTTELDLFIHPNRLRILREAHVKERPNLSDFFSSSVGATVQMGHGTQFGFDIPTISGPDEAQDFVDARIAEGADYIKIIHDDFSTYGGKRPTLDIATMKALVAAAHKRGKLALAHIGALEQAKRAIASGVDGLVHIFLDKVLDQEFIDLALEAKIFVIPTLAVLESLCGIAGSVELANHSCLCAHITGGDLDQLKNPYHLQKVNLDFAVAKENVRQLHQAGVPILAGSDAPNPGTAHGVSLHRELDLLLHAGLSPKEILSAATRQNAACFRLHDRGEIEKGRIADLVLLKGNPETQIEDVHNVLAVWKNGVRLQREKLTAPD